jgi:hypothetical protein
MVQSKIAATAKNLATPPAGGAPKPNRQRHKHPEVSFRVSSGISWF